ncbi:MAG TPA: maltose alpha-D-glucosyltransferase [Edaphobacter sp.]|nr:maltose alpha-D-glucosyltransferase [Edaphobacter sp.]
MKKAGSATDPLWYKDAIIYEIHVRAFMDSNADGIGDFQGLLSKLDYLQDLGVTCLWLLPFFPSPLRDDGYDIANYVDVNPSYGNLNDFKQFLDAAHLRNMQVMIELVINHTSDQHPWFQAARRAATGSPERDFYVWSETDQLFKDARIIFTDTEKSNWTWDEVAQAYYWHRFFSHQPDLNFDNPLVIEEVLKAMRFWLDMGVDALRMDAIPYLVERDGTSCENLPETHAAIKKIRAAIDHDYENRLVLAEANQWPTDVRPYFGDGDECHMAFHFPLMPRIYMALRQEDRLPITEIMAQTPPIPEGCQWGLFLRNHDELTLEMVTADERDYMYFAYSADPRMRVNVGIRRRLAPLVDNNRRRIELLNSLLLSFPGTPIIYYGDEIGMGDNIYLGDRNGVRTPMQWNSDRNAGFSTAVPARLYLPVIIDPIWGYQAINVEAQLSDQSSLLHWTRNMIALRRLFHVFGRGTQEFLNPENRKILAYVRQYNDASNGGTETVLCVANLSRFSQPVSLDLTKFAGMIPVEMLGYVTFPTITKQPYPLTLAPYSFLWLELQPAPQAVEPVPLDSEESHLNVISAGVEGFLVGDGLELLQKLLMSYLPRQRWFGAKSRNINAIELLDYAELSQSNAALLFLKLTYDDDSTNVYQFPLGVTTGVDAESIRASDPASIVAQVTTTDGLAILHEAVVREDVRHALLNMVEINGEVRSQAGWLRGRKSNAVVDLSSKEALFTRVASAEQSNTSLIYGDRFIMKLFRRLESGQNPDTEVCRFLTETAHFSRIPRFVGDITLYDKNDEPTTVAMLQTLVENEGDGWQWTLDELSHYYESVATLPAPHDLGVNPTFLLDREECAVLAREHAGLYLEGASLLGRRTAEMHLALATPNDDPAFIPEPFTADDLTVDVSHIDSQIVAALDSLKRGISQLSEVTADEAALVLSRRVQIFSRAHPFSSIKFTEVGQRIRIHGDYHLGQVLRSKSDYVIIDFEGEPARDLASRRAKQSPLKDVAGMLRSFSYAAYAALNVFAQRRPDDARNLEPWVKLWQNAVSTEFLCSYRHAIAEGNSRLIPELKQAQLLLDAYLLQKALYELVYELNNRPTWVRIPLAGILALTE